MEFRGLPTPIEVVDSTDRWLYVERGFPCEVGPRTRGSGQDGREADVALDRNRASTLARALRELREDTWPDVELTQAQLAAALSTEGRVAPATLSSWESATAPKTPSIARVSSYARFFCTRRSLDGVPHLIPEQDLTSKELADFRTLEGRLLDLLNPEDDKFAHTFQFETGPINVICPIAPSHLRGPLANEQHPNFNKLQQYGDLDALIELYGHLRAENPSLNIYHRLTSEVERDHLLTHVILLGGISWNPIARRFQSAISQVPITQVVVDNLEGGDIFQIDTPDRKILLYPEYEEGSDGKELVADIGFIARLRNPFKMNRTLTICNGIYSRGVFGAVRCLTDASVRDENERYIANRFPDSEFAMLLRVPIFAGEIVSPDLQNPDLRLYEWPPRQGVDG